MRKNIGVGMTAVGLMLACTGDGPSDPSSHQAIQSTAAPDSVILIAAGDVHGDLGTTVDGQCGPRTKRALVTAGLAKKYPDALVLPMGDNVMSGTVAEFACYNKSWGQLKSRTAPVIGNHERDKDLTATPYYDYFNGVGVDSGPAGHRLRGYYTIQYGSWLIMVANSNTNRTAQTTWMNQRMAATPRRCTMAVWHRPYFTSSAQPVNVQVDVGTSAWWKAMYAKDADVILNGHVHSYERFAKLRPDGTLDPVRGIRSIVAGTAGSGLYSFMTTPRVGSEKRIKTWGILKMVLWPDRYNWEFMDMSGAVLDRGQDTCH